MGTPASSTRLYRKGTFICVSDQTNLSSFLLCQTCQVVTSTSETIPVMWLKQTEQAEVFQYSFKSEVMASNILGVVVVTERGNEVVLDKQEMIRLEKLAEKLEEERGYSLDEKGMEVEGGQCRSAGDERTGNLMTELKIKADVSAVQGRLDKEQVMFENREPYIVEMDSLPSLKDLVKHTIDLVDNKMFLSFSSMADMMTYTGLVEEKTSVPHQSTGGDDLSLGGGEMTQTKTEGVGKASSEMCGVGEQCMRDNCGACSHYKDMTKFGGREEEVSLHGWVRENL